MSSSDMTLPDRLEATHDTLETLLDTSDLEWVQEAREYLRSLEDGGAPEPLMNFAGALHDIAADELEVVGWHDEQQLLFEASQRIRELESQYDDEETMDNLPDQLRDAADYLADEQWYDQADLMKDASDHLESLQSSDESESHELLKRLETFESKLDRALESQFPRFDDDDHAHEMRVLEQVVAYLEIFLEDDDSLEAYWENATLRELKIGDIIKKSTDPPGIFVISNLDTNDIGGVDVVIKSDMGEYRNRGDLDDNPNTKRLKFLIYQQGPFELVWRPHQRPDTSYQYEEESYGTL